MPVYGRPQLLDAAIKSLANQTFQDWELLISDDNSPDPEVRRICERHSSNDSRIRYMRRTQNLGAINNYIHVFDHTEAPFFMWAAEDDLWEPTFIERGVAALDADATKDAWFCQADRINKNGELYEILPPYTRFASSGRKRREVAWFLLEPERFHRVNIFYSIYRRKALAGMIPLLAEFGDAQGASQIFVYAFICRHDIAVSPETLFHKRNSTRVVKQRWRHANLLSNRHFKGYYRAAQGTQFQSLTALLLVPRFILDRAYKMRRLVSRNFELGVTEPKRMGSK
jgi:glycosyltransferase involved in cell wall biosynthesis